MSNSENDYAYLLRFGIPSLDRLVTGETGYGYRKNELPTGIGLRSTGSVSVSLVGPDGTGKSVLGLHLASRYITDCWERIPQGKKSRGGDDRDRSLPFVFYVSTDLNYEVAESRLWKSFHLNDPLRRTVPFARYPQYATRAKADESLTIELKRLEPLSDVASFDVASHLQSHSKPGKSVELSIGFVDLARNTAGDDWGYLTRLLALLPGPKDGAPRHLLVIDAVEGFEALVGERDAYGEPSSRRSRIAQLMRLASSGTGKCHIAFIVGAHTSEERLPEVFITDFVIRLREVEANGYVRRTAQIEKARGYAHARGQHPYVIRSGKGSSTGEQENVDDVAVGSKPDGQSYFHVFRSLHYLSRTTMQRRGDKRPEIKSKYAGFGVQYLDEMLDGRGAPARRTGPEKPGGPDRTDTSGLPCGSVTGLIGDSETQKSRLGRIFLSRCFASYPVVLKTLIKALVNKERVPVLTELVRNCKNVPKDFPFSRRSQKAFWKGQTKEKEFLKFVRLTCKDLRVRKMDADVWPVFLASRLLERAQRHPQDSVAILLTTRDIDNQTLARDFSGLLLKKDAFDNPWNRTARWLKEKTDIDVNTDVLRACAERHFSQRTLCRRLEIHDLSSPILMHIVQSYVQAAQRMQAAPGKRAEGSDQRMIDSIGIRMVIDDFSVIRATYPEVRTENLFLPYLLFYLRREGITTLIVNTDPEKPGEDCKDHFEQEFRSLVDHRLFTWHVPFFGQDRVAIAAIPPIGESSVIRELRKDGKTGVFVDPEFELYTGIEEGKPESIPLEVRLFQETPAFEQYIRRENLVYAKRFRPFSGRESVIVGQARDEYDVLRDWCTLKSPQNLDHTLVLQVDEFWGLRARAFRRENSYLGAMTVEDDGSAIVPVDSSDLFQQSEAMRGAETPRHRFEFFQTFGYKLKEKDSKGRKNKKDPEGLPERLEIDRIPFTWDFGFLLCRQRCWLEAQTARLPVARIGREPVLVGEVWNALVKIPASVESRNDRTHRSDAPNMRPSTKREKEYLRSWRTFLEACQVVARVAGSKTSTSMPAFDLSLLTPESFSCLVLEMWASELAKSNRMLSTEVSSRKWGEDEPDDERAASLVEWLVGRTFRKTIGQDYAEFARGKKTDCSRGWLALYKVWLLLAEVIELAEFIDPATSFEFKPRDGKREAMAIRHWYKTAAAQSDEFDPANPLLACRLPGCFTTRGDWFLAVLKGSLSDRLADQALDLLSSKRANRVRMQMGLGLPTRFPRAYGGSANRKNRANSTNSPNELVRIKLFKCGEKGERERASYQDILHISPERDPDFYWLWRSRVRNYDRHARIFQRWIGRTLLFWNRLRHDSGREWKSGFRIYDAADAPNFAQFCLKEDIKSLKMFAERCDFFLAELRDATLLQGG